jgi:DNA-binding beta-propeller fold protein YncE
VLASLLAATVVAAAPGVQIAEPIRVSLEPEGTLLVADIGQGRGKVVRVSPKTGARTVVPGTTGLGRVFDAVRRGRAVYVVADSRLLRVEQGRAKVVARGLRGPTDVALEPGGTALVAESQADRVVRVSLATGRVTPVVTRGLSQPLAVARGADGAVYVADGHSGTDGRVRRIERDGSLTPLIDGLVLPSSVEVLAGGRLLVVDHVAHEGKGSVFVYDGPNRAETLAERSIAAPTSATVARDGTVYVTSFGTPRLGRLVGGRLRAL